MVSFEEYLALSLFLPIFYIVYVELYEPLEMLFAVFGRPILIFIKLCFD